MFIKAYLFPPKKSCLQPHFCSLLDCDLCPIPLQFSFWNLAPSASILLPLNLSQSHIFHFKKKNTQIPKFSLVSYIPKVSPTHHIIHLQTSWVSSPFCYLDLESIVSTHYTLLLIFVLNSHKASSEYIQWPLISPLTGKISAASDTDHAWNSFHKHLCNITHLGFLPASLTVHSMVPLFLPT